MKKQQYDRSADGQAGERTDAANMGLRHTDARTDELIESGGFRDFLRRLFRQNPIAVISALVILAVILMAIFAPWIAPYKEAQQNLTARLKAPSPEHLFGTDELGRDVFTRILYGARVSLVVGLIPSAVSLLIGMTLGLTAGYYGGGVDYFIMRVADVLLSIPSLLLSMVVMFHGGHVHAREICQFARVHHGRTLNGGLGQRGTRGSLPGAQPEGNDICGSCALDRCEQEKDYDPPCPAPLRSVADRPVYIECAILHTGGKHAQLSRSRCAASRCFLGTDGQPVKAVSVHVSMAGSGPRPYDHGYRAGI